MSRIRHGYTRLQEYFVTSPWPYRLLRGGIGILFIWAGTIKLLHPKLFAHAIANYGILHDVFIAPVALGLPVLELLAGVGLLLDIGHAFRLTFGLLLLFMAVLAYAMLKGLDVDCGCFTLEETREHNDLRITFIRDAGLATSVLFLFYCRRARAAVLS